MSLSALDPDGPDLTVEEVCDLLRVSPRTVYRYCRKNRFPGCYLLEQQWRIPRQGLLTYARRKAAAG